MLSGPAVVSTQNTSEGHATVFFRAKPHHPPPQPFWLENVPHWPTCTQQRVGLFGGVGQPDTGDLRCHPRLGSEWSAVVMPAEPPLITPDYQWTRAAASSHSLLHLWLCSARYSNSSQSVPNLCGVPWGTLPGEILHSQFALDVPSPGNSTSSDMGGGPNHFPSCSGHFQNRQLCCSVTWVY